MTIETWLAYVLVTTVLMITPGPTIMLVVGYGISGGRGAALRVVPGVVLGDIVALTVSLAGIGAIVAASAALFTVLKLLGAAYLVYLGLRMWRAPEEAVQTSMECETRSGRTATLHAFAVTAANPKSLAFFAAFLPQFLSSTTPAAPQLFILGATFLILALGSATAYALLAGAARDWLLRARVLKTANRIGGSILVLAGLSVALLRKNA